MEQRAIWRSVRAAVRLYAVSTAIVLALYRIVMRKDFRQSMSASST